MNTYDFLTEKRQAEKAEYAYAILSGGASHMRANALRDAVEQAAAAMPDEDAASVAELFPFWTGTGKSYSTGVRVRFDNALYRCLQDHQSQPGWTPVAAASLWSRILIPNSALIPEWVQPDSTNPYMRGDKVRYKDRFWISDLDQNVWAPGAHGWSVL